MSTAAPLPCSSHNLALARSYGDALRSLSATVAGYGQFFTGQFPAQCR